MENPDDKKGNNNNNPSNKSEDSEKSKENPENNNNTENNNDHQKNKKEKKRKEYKIFYTDYGYIKIEKNDLDNQESSVVKFIQLKLPPYRLRDCLIGSISRDKCYKEINFKVKSFYGEREIISLEKIDIFLTLSTVISDMIEKNTKIINKENSNIKITKKSQYRIYSCYKDVHELNSIKSIFENDIQNNELLIFLPIKMLSFSEYIKGRSIVISKENKVASKNNTDEPQYILGDIMYSSGKHYFEINLLTEPIAKSITVGLATKKNPFDLYINDVNNFYGYVLSDKKKISVISGKQVKKDYGKEQIGINDIIGVLFEFKIDGLEISFYKNKICLGVAFDKIKNEKYIFPAVSLGLAGSKVRISNQIDFP